MFDGGVCVTKWCSYGLVLGIDVAVLTGTQSFREAMMVPCHRPGSISFYPDKWVCLGHSTMGRSWVDGSICYSEWHGGVSNLRTLLALDSRSINCIMMTCHATFVAQGENIVLWTICLLVFVCVCVCPKFGSNILKRHKLRHFAIRFVGLAAVQVRKNPQTLPRAEFLSHLVMAQR